MGQKTWGSSVLRAGLSPGLGHCDLVQNSDRWAQQAMQRNPQDDVPFQKRLQLRQPCMYFQAFVWIPGTWWTVPLSYQLTSGRKALMPFSLAAERDTQSKTDPHFDLIFLLVSHSQHHWYTVLLDYLWKQHVLKLTTLNGFISLLQYTKARKIGAHFLSK